MRGHKARPGLLDLQALAASQGGGIIYAHILPSGEVDANRSNGVASSDVERISGDDPFSRRITRILPVALNDAYCFTIPANGAQVTIDSSDAPAGLTSEVTFHPNIQSEYGCTFVVTFADKNGDLKPAGFYILIY